MFMPVCKISVVCPAYEEEEVLPRFHSELRSTLDRLGDDYEIEILYVDDGSQDGTLEVLRQLADEDGRVRYLSLSRNFGHQAALTAGLEHAGGEVVITLDSDLQHPPALIPVLLARWREGYDIVQTLRQDDPNLGAFKRLTSSAFYRLMRWLSDTEVRTAASDFRLLSRKAVDALLRLQETHRFLRGMVHWLGFRMATVSFMPASRAAGISKYTLRRMIGFAADGMLSFSKLPLRISLLLGGMLLLGGLTYGGGALLAALLGALTQGAMQHVVVVLLLLVGGCVLCSLGVVGEYLGRVYEQVKGRPIYLLKERSALLSPALKNGAEGESTASKPYRSRPADGAAA
jgi:dolichol-phosphate mannosyltransferase